MCLIERNGGEQDEEAISRAFLVAAGGADGGGSYCARMCNIKSINEMTSAAAAMPVVIQN